MPWHGAQQMSVILVPGACFVLIPLTWSQGFVSLSQLDWDEKTRVQDKWIAIF